MSNPAPLKWGFFEITTFQNILTVVEITTFQNILEYDYVLLWWFVPVVNGDGAVLPMRRQQEGERNLCNSCTGTDALEPTYLQPGSVERL